MLYSCNTVTQYNYNASYVSFIINIRAICAISASWGTKHPDVCPHYPDLPVTLNSHHCHHVASNLTCPKGLSCAPWEACTLPTTCTHKTQGSSSLRPVPTRTADRYQWDDKGLRVPCRPGLFLHLPGVRMVSLPLCPADVSRKKEGLAPPGRAGTGCSQALENSSLAQREGSSSPSRCI